MKVSGEAKVRYVTKTSAGESVITQQGEIKLSENWVTLPDGKLIPASRIFEIEFD